MFLAGEQPVGAIDQDFGLQKAKKPAPTSAPDSHWPEEWIFPDGGGSSVRLVIPSSIKHIDDAL
ncbi:hypothetical protein HYU13_01945 [Candidatus Woesearchaeota archaeon]|nr:hypothetical protein [Candidatus Woesearchaeota archaeon]